MGFLPSSIALRVNFIIVCDYHNFEGLRSVKEMNNSRNHRIERNSCEKLLTHLESVFGFKTGTKLDICVAVCEPKEGDVLEGVEWVCNTVLPFIFPTFQRFEDAGYRANLDVLRSALDSKVKAEVISIQGQAITPQVWKAVYETVSSSTGKLSSADSSSSR